MLAKKDLSQMREYVIGILPQLLREEPEITTTIEGILAHQFPRRNEFSSLLDEFKLLREDINRQFEAHRKETERRFELMERKFEAYLQETERRFELMEQKFEAQRQETERRFDLMEQKFEAHRQETERRFDALHKEMNQRFEQVDKRFEQVDQRFEQIDKRLDKQHADILDVKRRVIKLESTVDRVEDKMTRFDIRLNILAGTLGTEKGQRLEEVFAHVLSYGLKNPDLKPESIQLRQQFVDTEGLVYLRKGKFIEVDIIIENGKFTVFEVKATVTVGNVDEFARKVKLIELQNPDKQVRGIIISPWADEEVKQCCIEYDLELLD